MLFLLLLLVLFLLLVVLLVVSRSTNDGPDARALPFVVDVVEVILPFVLSFGFHDKGERDDGKVLRPAVAAAEEAVADGRMAVGVLVFFHIDDLVVDVATPFFAVVVFALL